MRVRLDEHAFSCIESPLPVVGEGWGEGRMICSDGRCLAQDAARTAA
jgi:hypothetical protein